MTEDLSSLIARRLGLPAPGSSNATSRVERRRLVDRCAGCGASGRQYAFMSNGEHRCVPCAEQLAQDYGYRPVGVRADDIVALA